MRRLLFLFPILLALAVPARAEPGHQFPPIKPDELARIQAALPWARNVHVRPRRLLVFYRTEGFVHASIPYANEAIRAMGEKTGAFTADFSDDMAVFTPEKLGAYDAILFNSTTGLKFTEPAAREALLGFVRADKGIVGIHAATDNFPTWEDGRALMGGTFDGHPWTAGDVEAVKIDDPANPIVAPFDGKGFWVNDEIYQMKAPYDRGQVRELLSLDMARPENARPPEKIHRTDGDLPICWIKGTEGGGRVFYCSLGHNPSIFWNPQVLRMYLNGIQFALGDLALDTTPTGKLASAPPAALAPVAPAPINKPSPSDDPLVDGIKAVAAYQDGIDRTSIVAFDNYIRTHPDDQPRVEGALRALLTRDDLSPGAKDYVCRRLAVIGTDASVPTLRKLTADPKLGHLAVSALLGLRTPAARAALLDGLETVPPPLRPALIGAVGRAGVADAVPALAKAASSADAPEATAALDALGIIGTPAALETLHAAQVPAPLETARQWALLHAAESVSKKGAAGLEAAKGIFASLLAPGTPATLRTAAAAAAVHADPATALTVVLPLFKDDDARVRFGAARLTPSLPAEALQALAPSLVELDPSTQVAVVDNLAQTPPAGVGPVLQAALASTRAEVRQAAMDAYGATNQPDAVAVLLPLLSGSGDGNAAADGLKKSSLPDTGARLREAADGATGPVKASLLAILAARQDRSALDLFAASTGDADPAVATAAFRSVETVAGANDLERIAGLLPQARTGAEHKSLDTALLRCARIAADKDQAADFLLAALREASPETRSILFAALASVPSAKATAYLRTQLSDPSVDTRKDAIRALGAAHTPEADRLLLGAASQGAESSEKILALRGYLDDIPTRPGPQQIEAYRAAWPLTIRPEEKQAILDALKHIPGPDAKKVFEDFSAQLPKST